MCCQLLTAGDENINTAQEDLIEDVEDPDLETLVILRNAYGIIVTMCIKERLI